MFLFFFSRPEEQNLNVTVHFLSKSCHYYDLKKEMLGDFRSSVILLISPLAVILLACCLSLREPDLSDFHMLCVKSFIISVISCISTIRMTQRSIKYTAKCQNDVDEV